MNTNTVDGVVVNPCGVLRGQTARFRIEISPQAFPESNIVWNASNSGALVPPTGLLGREISVTGGIASGGSMLRADIAGWDGPAPFANVHTISSETVIPLYAWIVCSTNGPVTDAATVRARVAGANDIYRQVGRRFVLQEPIGFTATNMNWAVIKKVGNGWPAFDSLVDTHHMTDGIEVYFVESIDDANGITSLQGCAIRASAGANSLAHELGHAQGLPDIYGDNVEGMPNVAGPVSRERLPGDWGSQDSEGFYPPTLMQTELITRALMYGRCSPTKSDITTGSIRAIWKPTFTDEPLRESNAPVGFFKNAYPNPHSN